MTIIFVEALHGINYHRLIVPFLRMQEKGLVNLHVVSDAFELLDFDLTHVDTFVVSRTLYSKMEGAELFVQRLKENNVKFIVDLDDYWKVEKHNPSFKAFRGRNGFSYAIQNTVALADEIWTPSEYLANEIRTELNPTALFRIIPNGINPEEDQWLGEKSTGDNLWFGYTGASSHMKDVQLVKHIDWEAYNTMAVHMGGVDYVGLFKANKQILAQPIFRYATIYQEIDVSVVPLQDTHFNRCKSSIKAAEAGFTRTAMIASDVEPYREVIVNNETGILCSNMEQWQEAIASMTKKEAKRLGDNLYESVREKYHIDTVNEERLKGLNHAVSHV
jgi:glycosyltransferase involved in cell wall biosynthesis